MVGEIALLLGGSQPWVAAVAVGVAILLMLATDSFHPPAGINPLIIVTHGMSWSFVAGSGRGRCPDPAGLYLVLDQLGAAHALARPVVLRSLRGLLQTLRQPEAVAVGLQPEMPVMQSGQGRTMTDRDDGRPLQPGVQQPVEPRLGGFVERSGGLVQKQEIRLLQQRAGDAEPLLFAER